MLIDEIKSLFTKCYKQMSNEDIKDILKDTIDYNFQYILAEEYNDIGISNEIPLILLNKFEKLFKDNQMTTTKLLHSFIKYTDYNGNLLLAELSEGIECTIYKTIFKIVEKYAQSYPETEEEFENYDEEQNEFYQELMKLYAESCLPCSFYYENGSTTISTHNILGKEFVVNINLKDISHTDILTDAFKEGLDNFFNAFLAEKLD